MRTVKHLTIISFSTLLLMSCDVHPMVKHTVETSDGSKIGVQIAEAQPTRGLSNPVAHMIVVFSTAPITLRKAAFIEAAEKHSRCEAVKDTFIFQNSMNGMAAVELNCD